MYGDNQNPSSNMTISSSGTAALRMPDVGVKQGEISIGFEMLHKASDELRQSLSALESKLSPILKPTPECGETKQSVPEPVRTPLAETIHQRTQELYSFNAKVRSLLELIEL